MYDKSSTSHSNPLISGRTMLLVLLGGILFLMALTATRASMHESAIHAKEAEDKRVAQEAIQRDNAMKLELAHVQAQKDFEIAQAHNRLVLEQKALTERTEQERLATQRTEILDRSAREREVKFDQEQAAILKNTLAAKDRLEAERKARQDAINADSEDMAFSLGAALKDAFYGLGPEPLPTTRKTFDDVYPIYSKVALFIGSAPNKEGVVYKDLLLVFTFCTKVLAEAQHKKQAWADYVARINDPLTRALEEKKLLDLKVQHAQAVQTLEQQIRERQLARARQRAAHDAQDTGTLGGTGVPYQYPYNR